MYFVINFICADPDKWTSPLGVQVPMLLTVKGKTYHPVTTGRDIDHSYTFTGFSDFIPDRIQPYFQVIIKHSLHI